MSVDILQQQEIGQDANWCIRDELDQVTPVDNFGKSLLIRSFKFAGQREQQLMVYKAEDKGG